MVLIQNENNKVKYAELMVPLSKETTVVRKTAAMWQKQKKKWENNKRNNNSWISKGIVFKKVL